MTDRKYRYLPEAKNDMQVIGGVEPTHPQAMQKTASAKAEEETPGIYPCPCCGFLTLPVPAEEAIAYICPVCFWENDVFLGSDEEPSDENHGRTLRAARECFRLHRVSDLCFRQKVRDPYPQEIPGKQDSGN